VHHGHYTDDSSGISAAMMAILMVALLGVVLLVVAFAWAPWNANNERTIIPGQGGSDENVPTVSTPSSPAFPPEINVTPSLPR
jgi:hypothetical protein